MLLQRTIAGAEAGLGNSHASWHTTPHDPPPHGPPPHGPPLGVAVTRRTGPSRSGRSQRRKGRGLRWWDRVLAALSALGLIAVIASITTDVTLHRS